MLPGFLLVITFISGGVVGVATAILIAFMVADQSAKEIEEGRRLYGGRPEAFTNPTRRNP